MCAPIGWVSKWFCLPSVSIAQSFRYNKRKKLDPVGFAMAPPKPTRQDTTSHRRSDDTSDRKSDSNEAPEPSAPRCMWAPKVQVVGPKSPCSKSCLRTSIAEQPQHAEVAAHAAAQLSVPPISPPPSPPSTSPPPEVVVNVPDLGGVGAAARRSSLAGMLGGSTTRVRSDSGSKLARPQLSEAAIASRLLQGHVSETCLLQLVVRWRRPELVEQVSQSTTAKHTSSACALTSAVNLFRCVCTGTDESRAARRANAADAEQRLAGSFGARIC